MRFSETRAAAFARYTLPGLLTKSGSGKDGKFILWMTRAELAAMLGMTNSRLEHAQYVAEQAAKDSIVTAITSGWVYFFYDADAVNHGDQLDIKSAAPVTDAFEKVYGSQACEDMYEAWDDNDVSPAAPIRAAKPKGPAHKKASA